MLQSLNQILWINFEQGVSLYIDDVIAAADTKEEFLRLLRGVVVAFSKHQIKCKLAKFIRV